MISHFAFPLWVALAIIEIGAVSTFSEDGAEARLCEVGGVCKDGISLLQVGTGNVHERARKQRTEPDAHMAKVATQQNQATVVSRFEHSENATHHFTAVEAGRYDTNAIHHITAVNYLKDDTNATLHNHKTCLLNTGGTCTFDSCDRVRGPTTCYDDMCLCSNGCAGADGTCTNHNYKVILESFTLRDFRYGQYLIADDSTADISTSHDKSSRYNLFTLVETHDHAYVMYSKGSPDYAVQIAEERDDKDRTWWTVGQVQVKGDDGFDISVPSFALVLTGPPGGYDDSRRPKEYPFNGERPVMLQSFKHPGHYIYSQYAGDADVNKGDPGDGGLWIFDPPLPDSFYKKGSDRKIGAFRGEVCSFDCHGKGSGSWNSAWIIVMIVIGLCICCCLLAWLTVRASPPSSGLRLPAM